MKRVKPHAKCANCGRTVALKDSKAAVLAARFDMGRVVPASLRPHKCSHGRYCDECKEKHS